MAKSPESAPPQFTLLSAGTPLYRTDPAPAADAPQLLYALVGTPASFPAGLAAGTAWSDWSGAFLYLPPGAPVDDAGALVAAIDELLSNQQVPFRQWVMWLPAGDAQSVSSGCAMFAINKAAGSGDGHLAGSTALPFANLSVQLSAGLTVHPDFDAPEPGLVLVPDRQAGTTVVLQQNATGASVQMPNTAQLSLPFAGTRLGLLCLPLNGDAGLFYALFTPGDGSETPPASAECRFYFGAAASPTTLRFPLLLGADPNPAPPPSSLLPLLASIDPLAPADTARTRFAFDLAQYGGSGPALPVSDALRTSAGAALTLTAREGAGFGLGLGPGGAGAGAAYLVPAGEFLLGRQASGLQAENPPLAQGAIELMCGVYGTEFLLLADGDVISFGGNAPAYAPDFKPPAGTGGSRDEGDTPLTDACSTSWVKVIPRENTAKTFPGPINQSFCAQAFGSVYYQTQPGQDLPLPIAIGARIADLSDPAAGQHLPIAPYGLVFYSDDNVDNPNPGVTAGEIVAFDSTILSRARFLSLAPDRCLGPLFFDMARIEALAGGYVRTPQGLLVGLNDGELDGPRPAGTWQTLLLARSPQDPGQLLRFRAATAPSGCVGGTGPYEVVSPYLSTALMDPAAVLFVARPDYLGTFDNLIQLGEFPIQIAVANGSEGDEDNPLGTNCVLLFKFAIDRSAADLAADVASWGSVGFMTGDSAAAERISKQLVAYIEQAKAQSAAAKKAGAYDYFADFLARIGDAGWTGIIAFNPQLDQQSLPADIQMLLCGMRGNQGLRCHHFGITTNSGPGTGDPADAIDQSSLFGLVHYDAAFQPPSGQAGSFDFQTLRLNVLFDNSVVKHFDSRIAMSLPTVLGNPAALTVAGANDHPDTNTIVIDGVLQIADGVTRIVFVTDEERAFTMPKSGSAYRVLARQSVGRAGLAPVVKDGGSGTLGEDPTVTVTAQFTLDGSFGFNTRPTGSGIADLFSYGIDQEGDGGLGYSGYALTMVSHVPTTGPTPPPTISPPPGAMQIDASAGLPRDQSLMATLPLKVTAFSTAMPGPGRATQVTGIGLDGATPVYALATELMMGTLGGLSDSGPLEGQLLLGWVPGGEDNVPDKTGALLAAPPSMQDGSFKLQGVIPSVYGPVELLRPKLNDSFVYVLVLHDVQFALGAFGLYIPSMGERSLTFFGEPGGSSSSRAADGDDAVTLSWFLGEPDLDTAVVRPIAPYAQDGTSISLNFTPAVYVLAGVKVSYDRQASSIVDEVISNLAQVPLSTKAALGDILSGATTIPVNYDPHAGVTVAVDLQFPQVSFKFVFSDPYVYGGYLAIAKSGDDGDGDGDGDGKDGKGTKDSGSRAAVVLEEPEPEPEKKKGILSSLDGFELEIAYRKISDGLGAWSASFTISGHIGTDDYYLQLPTVGLVIYTNNDFRIDIGWPFSPGGGGAQTIAVQFQIEGVPLRAEAGLYLAKLRSADAPESLGSDFAVIWRFGLGLSFGLNKSIDKGPMSLTAGLVAFLTFEGFLASKHGDMTEGGVDYKWFAGQLGAKAYFSGEVDLKIVMIGVSASATLALQVAYETDHATVIRLAFHLSVSVEFRILFIKVSFSFDADLDIFPPIKIGSGPDASIDGPDPTGSARLLAEPSPDRPRKEIEPDLLALHAAVGAGLTVPLRFVLQPTLVNAPDNGSAAPQAVASLVINLLPDRSDSDDFSRFATVLAGWLVDSYGGQGKLGDQLDAVATALAAGTVDGAVDGFLAENFTFQIEAAGGLDSEANFAAFPMLGPLMLRYAGAEIRFDAPPVPAGYPAALHDYFRQLSRNLRTLPDLLASGSDGPSAAELVCSDMIVLVARQLVSQLRAIVDDNPDDSLGEALTALGPPGFANVAGIASRFAYHGVRLPAPGTQPFGSVLEGLYVLTAQQVALQQDAGKWQTSFTLSLAPGEAAPWITFGASGGDSSVADTLDPNLVLTEPVAPAWLSAGGGLLPFPPVRQDASLFYLGQPIVWTTAGGDASAILPLGDELARRLAAFTAAGGFGAAATVRQVTAPPPPPSGAKLADSSPLPGTAALFVPIALRQITPPGGGKPLDSVFELVGTDDRTRALLETLVRDPIADTGLSFLLSTGNASYAAPSGAAQIVLAKANLSTLNEPPALASDGRFTAAEQPPLVSATLAEVTDFLTLVWEESVVHSGGFYLYLANLPAGAFTQGTAAAALLVELGGGAAAEVPLPAWCNSISLTPVPVSSAGAVTATVSDPNGVWSQASPNHGAGLAGFEIVWPQPPAQPSLDARSTPAQKAAYAEALYSLLQYRVTAFSGGAGPQPSLPTNWSLPVGPTQADLGQDWHFSSTVAVSGLLGAQNRYAGAGGTVTFGVTLLDLYGNQLPTEHGVAVEVVYNDPLLGLDSWPGARGFYSFGPDGPGTVAMTLAVDFDPARLGTGKQDATARAVLENALSAYRTVLDQLTDPLQAGKAGAGASLVTVFAAQPITHTDAGTALTDALVTWVEGVIEWLEAAIAGKPPPVPTVMLAGFALDLAAAKSLPSDLTPLSVSLLFARDPATVSPEIAKALPSVQQVGSTLGAAASLDPRLFAGPAGPDLQLAAFARAFETAWYGFDGGTGQLKLAQGLTGQAVTDALPAALWFVRVGTGAGIGIVVPNAGTPDAAGLPATFAPPPLSTVLISQDVEVRTYTTDWAGDGGDVILPDQDHSFVNIDMTAWAVSFLAATEALFGPEMAAAIATLDPDTYQELAGYKEQLASVIAPTLAPVLTIPGQSPESGPAVERFRQALLENLGTAYALSAVVTVPTQVTLAGDDEPSAPPRIYGRPGGPGLGRPGGKQPYALSPASIELKTGASQLVYLVSSRTASARAWLDTPLTYDVAFLEHDFRPNEKLFGYEPSSWLSFIIPDFQPKGDVEALGFPLGRNAIPLPLRVYPTLPAITEQAAVMPSPTSLAEALTWSYRCTVATPQAAQDELLLSLILNDPPPLPPAPQAAVEGTADAADDPPRPAPKDLFEALARFAFEYPQIAPHLAQVAAAAFAGGDAQVARKALERMGELIAGAAGTWAEWINPALRPAPPAWQDAPPPVARAVWNYVVDFSGLPALRVTRSLEGGGPLPPWPQIAGFTTPAENGQPTDTYQPVASSQEASTLTFTFEELPTTAVQSAHVAASVTRNANLVPPQMPQGTSVNPAFVYRTAEVSAKDPVLPLLDLPSQGLAIGDGAASLSAAIDCFLDPFTAQSSLAGVAVRELRLEVGGAYWFLLAQGGEDQTIRSGNKIFLSRSKISLVSPAPSGSIPVASFRKELIDSLTGWHSAMQPSDAGASIQLPVTLYAAIVDRLLPLVRLGNVEIAVPSGRPGWWS